MVAELDPKSPEAGHPDAVRSALATALDVDPAAIGEEPIRGRVHDHWRLGDGLLARVPRMSHLGLAPADNLAYAEAAFRRAAPSGAVPRLDQVLPVSIALPWGALIVEEVGGRTVRLPEDLARIATALAALHAEPLPVAADRAPILDPLDPIGYVIEVVNRQLDGLEGRVSEDAARILEEERAWAGAFADATRRTGRVPPKVLAFADTHPGNFRIVADGVGNERAVLIDVERPVYDGPGIDLAHASLPTSLIWDPAVVGGDQVGVADIRAFHETWSRAVPATLASEAEPWITPQRRLIWLRTTSWACAWAARNGLWSGSGETTPLARRLARFVDPSMMEKARDWWR